MTLFSEAEKRIKSGRTGKVGRRIKSELLSRRDDAAPAAPPAGPTGPSTVAAGRMQIGEVSDEAALWLDKARLVTDFAGGEADEAERLRHLTDPVADALKSADFARLMVPKAFGGYQASLVTAMRVVEAFAETDGSLGWNMWVTVGHGRMADCLSDAAAEEVFRDGSVVAGSATPAGTAVAVDGGYRVSGQWPFASASYLANWLIAASYVDGSQHGTAGEALAFMMPRSECEILDTWHTTGLKATGSQDYTADDVFVPSEFAFPVASIFAVLPDRPSLGYGRPYSEYASVLMSMVALGVARHAIDSYCAMQAQRRAAPSRQDGHLDASHNERVGRAEALYQSSRTWLYQVGYELDALRPGDPSHTMRARHAGAHVAAACEQAVDLLYEVSGRRAIYTAASPLDRCFRDVHMVTHHGSIGFGAFADGGNELIASALAP